MIRASFIFYSEKQFFFYSSKAQLSRALENHLYSTSITILKINLTVVAGRQPFLDSGAAFKN